jgi:hypothetical protein
MNLAPSAAQSQRCTFERPAIGPLTCFRLIRTFDLATLQGAVVTRVKTWLKPWAESCSPSGAILLSAPYPSNLLIWRTQGSEYFTELCAHRKVQGFATG